jgi:hypothetical protein
MGSCGMDGEVTQLTKHNTIAEKYELFRNIHYMYAEMAILCETFFKISE